MNDLTNPDVLAALEIAPVEYEKDTTLCSALGVIEGKVFAGVMSGEVFCHMRLATPADLDHALVYWLFTWLPKRIRKLAGNSGDSWVETDHDHESFTLAAHWRPLMAEGHFADADDNESPLLAVAQAVVEVGKPAEETSDA